MKYNNVEIRDNLPDERPRLPEEIKTIWVAALRSGLFPQGQGAMCRDEAYCCLGVLSKVQGRLVWVDGSWCDVESYFGAALSATNPLYNITDGSGELAVNVYLTVGDLVTVCGNLASLNDNGASFHEIAWVIETLF